LLDEVLQFMSEVADQVRLLPWLDLRGPELERNQNAAGCGCTREFTHEWLPHPTATTGLLPRLNG